MICTVSYTLSDIHDHYGSSYPRPSIQSLVITSWPCAPQVAHLPVLSPEIGTAWDHQLPTKVRRMKSVNILDSIRILK